MGVVAAVLHRCFQWRILVGSCVCVLLLYSNLLRGNKRDDFRRGQTDGFNWTYPECPDVVLNPNEPWSLTRRDSVPQNQSDPSSCRPADHVAFLKTHKCASTTLQNIFLRYAHRHRLNPVLPKYGNYLSRKVPFEAAMASWHPRPPAGFHLVAHHMIWSRDPVASLLGPGAVYASVVRDPVEQFESLYSYSGLDSVYQMSLDEFGRAGGRGADETKRVGGNVGRDQMLFDFGLPAKSFDDRCDVLRKIRAVEDEFDLIMVVERFEESLVLLNRLLCWSWDDLAYVTLNSRRRGSADSDLSPEARRGLRAWLRADQTLYDYFAAKFRATAAALDLGPGLEQLREANERVRAACGLRYVSDAARLPHADRPYQFHKLRGVAASNANETCADFVRTENGFTDLLRDELLRRLRATSSGR